MFLRNLEKNLRLEHAIEIDEAIADYNNSINETKKILDKIKYMPEEDDWEHMTGLFQSSRRAEKTIGEIIPIQDDDTIIRQSTLLQDFERDLMGDVACELDEIYCARDDLRNILELLENISKRIISDYEREMKLLKLFATEIRNIKSFVDMANSEMDSCMKLLDEYSGDDKVKTKLLGELSYKIEKNKIILTERKSKINKKIQNICILYLKIQKDRKIFTRAYMDYKDQIRFNDILFSR